MSWRARFYLAVFVGACATFAAYFAGWADGWRDAEKTAGHVICAKDGERCPP